MATRGRFGVALLPLLVFGALTLDQRLAKWKPVDMPFDSARFSARERQMIAKLAEACRYLDQIYWRQSDPEGEKLLRSTKDPQVRRLLAINGSRYDLIDENRPFVGDKPMPPGRNLYPAGLTRADIEQYCKQHPEQKDAIYSQYTVVRGTKQKLETSPYHVAYKDLVDPMAQALRDAAAFSDDAAFANFLRQRADALQTDDYYKSDLAWLDLKDPKFDIIFAPYETYLDDLLGVKGSYGASILIRNEAESRKLAVYQKYVPDIQDALPLAAQDRPSKRGHATPMEVADAPLRAGDLLHGYQAVADNLPNDPRIHQEKGTKKIFFKNFMDARVNYVILPLARRLMDPAQAKMASAEGVMAGVLLHEISHGLGPAFARRAGKQVDIREAIGPAYSGLEEAKADVVGMYGLQWLMDHGAVPKQRAQEYYASYVAHIFRTLRFGTAEAHGRAEMMEFNFLSEKQAIRQNGGRYSVDFQTIPGALAVLAKELLEIEATGDRDRAEKWFQKYDRMPADLKVSLDKVIDVPVDIEPVFALAKTH